MTTIRRGSVLVTWRRGRVLIGEPSFGMWVTLDDAALVIQAADLDDLIEALTEARKERP